MELNMNSEDALIALSEDERIILREFRDSVQDLLKPHHDDYFLVRWLKARSFDLGKSEKMIRESFKFKTKVHVDEIISGKYVEPKVHKLYNTTAPLGFDKQGSFVRLIMAGICDFKGFAYSLHLTDILKMIMYTLECDYKLIVENNVKKGLHEVRSVYLVDFRDFNLRQFQDKYVLHVAIQVLSMYQDNYPETLKVAFLINVPTYFNLVWSLLKPFLHPVTLSKIRVYKTENLAWKNELFDMVDPKIVPACLGGLRCDPNGDPACQDLIKWVDKIPTSFYLKDKFILRSDDPDVKTIVVRERSYYEYRILVEKPGSSIGWEFQTKDYNIRFGIFYEKLRCNTTSTALPDELLIVDNVECHVIPERGELLCEKAGQYIFHFDNTYSWWTPKRLFYKVTVNEPEETTPEVN